MHWLLNKRNIDANGHKQLIENLVRMGISHSYCEMDLSGLDESITETMFPFGSYTTAKLLKERGYNAAVFMSNNINYSSLLKHWGNELANSDAVIAKLKDAKPISDEFFIRTDEDSKAIQAMVMTSSSFLDYQEKVRAGAYPWLTGDEVIVMSSPKRIQAEYRLFIADQKVIGKSMYKLGNYAKLDANVDDYIVDYAERIAGIWSPERAYTLDVCIINNEPKVLEVNGIHASGLYAIDTQKFINGIEQL